MKSYFLTFLCLLGLVLSCSAQEKEAKTVKLFRVERGHKCGYMDYAGKVVIKQQFDECYSFSEGLAAVQLDSKWGYIDETGSILIKPRFFSATPFKEGLAVVGAYFDSGPVNDVIGNYGYIDKTGNYVIAPQFAVAFNFSDELAQILTEDFEHGYIDKTGNIVFRHNWDTEDFSDGLALFKTNGNMPDSRTGYLDKRGNIALSPQYDWGDSFSEGLACVSLNKKAGFIDTKDNMIITFQFDYCSSFSEGLAAVEVEGKWGYVNKAGEVVIAPQFSEAEGFSDGVAVVRTIGKGDVKRIEGDRSYITQTGKYGVIDKSGRMILPAQFKQIGNFCGGLAWVNLGDSYIVHGSVEKWGYINKAGSYVWKSFVDKK